MDFSAFYSAGQSLNYGLDPYQNNVQINTKLWDGIDRYTHSRYLYPPLVAYLFEPLALIPYFYAKILWALLNIFLIFMIFKQLLNYFKIYNIKTLFFCLSFTFLFYPTLTFFERGQIDMVTLILIIIAFFSLLKQKNILLAGMLFALSTIIKLNCIYLAPIFLIQGGRKIILSFFVFILISLIIPTLFNYNLTMNYLTREFPRISRYGESGTNGMLLQNNNFIDKFNKNSTIRDNRAYLFTSFSFISNTSLSRVIYINFINKDTRYLPPAWLQFFVFIILSSIIFSVYIIKKHFRTKDINIIYIYLILFLMIVMLTSPAAWVMNLIWLIIILPWLIINYNYKLSNKFIYLIFFALIFMGIPDYLLTNDPSKYNEFPYNLKYVFSELLIYLFLLIYLLNYKKNEKYSKYRFRFNI